MLPFVQETFAQAHAELSELRDDIILYKRIHQVKEEEGHQVVSKVDDPSSHAISELLNAKWHCYEECFYRWVNVLTERGIQVRDFKKGLIDFPYRAKNGAEYFLCWHLGEDGLFYFHDVYEGFTGRKPISLLPE